MFVAMPEDLHLDLNLKTTRQEKEFLLLFKHRILHLFLPLPIYEKTSEQT